MSDAAEKVAEAVALTRRLAASLQVRKQELEAELAAGPAEGGAEPLAAELARVESELQGAMTELAELRKLAARAESGAARSLAAEILEPDPISASYEARALDAVRAHIADLDAQARLGESRPRAPSGEEPLARDEADEKARAEFEALRANRKAPPKKTL